MSIKNFNAISVALKGTNLIEASAGTGKTYSIAILVLRMIVEQGISMEKILMVTFTKAAVAELHERVRLFVKQAHQCIQGKETKDESINIIIKNASDTLGRAIVQERIEEAILLLDELSVITIHSFCQQTLKEFAFETKQLFGAEMMADTSAILEQEVNNFWRRYVTTLDINLLKQFNLETLREDIKNIVSEHLDGKKYAAYDENTLYAVTDMDWESYATFSKEMQATAIAAEVTLVKLYEQYIQDITAVCNQSRAKTKKEFIEALPDAKAFIQLLSNSKPNVLTKALPAAFLDGFNIAQHTITRTGAAVENYFIEKLYCFAIQEISAHIKAFMLRNNFLGYNDLIKNLHKALTIQSNPALATSLQKEYQTALHKALTEQPNPSLVAALQNKYHAVFVDEFQDTNREQYEIFRNAFFTNTILFLIGDPKQSIYAWRKADIETYFKAKHAVDNVFDMSTNFRSSNALIQAMNTFFLPQPDFDTFFFPDGQDSIRYTPVDAPIPDRKGSFNYQGDIAPPISIRKVDKKESLIYAVCQQIQILLTDKDYKIGKDNKTIKPSDIGILIRKNSDGFAIKNQLSQRGIPAIMIHDEKIFASQEAKDLLALLSAIHEPNLSAINKALLNKLTGFSIDDILKLDEEKILSSFQEYKNTWQQNGVYPAITKFLVDFNIHQNLIGNHEKQGQRSISNLIQLMELLNQSVHSGSMNQEELLAWFRRAVNGLEIKGDEYQMRMESDEDAVKIITIHKSKGLEYPIVFAPFLDMMHSNKFPFQKFRNPNNGDYMVRETQLMTAEEIQWNETQLEQENRRLIYVAVTRAVYKCFIYEVTSGYYNNSSLKPFVRALENTTAGNIELTEQPMLIAPSYQSSEQTYTPQTLIATRFTLSNENWHKLSYTGLSYHGTPERKERTENFDSEYEQFILSKLRPGAASGNLLHSIFEDIDFGNKEYWDKKIDQSLAALLPNKAAEFAPFLRQLLDIITETTIKIGSQHLQLNQVNTNQMIAELEFDFPVNHFQTQRLQAAVSKQFPVLIKSFEQETLEGIMNGKIDLFFAHNNRYYILDWKSNYLGYTPESYNSEGVAAAMTENNYHLQYLIYTVAVKKYLSSRLPDFNFEKQFGGVIYLFLRGIRKDSSNGIFTTRPNLDIIEKLEQILFQR